MTPEMAVALSSGRAMVTALFQIDLPSGTRRLMLGAGEVQWNADKFVGKDPTFGFVTGGEEMREDITGQAPNTAITIQPAAAADRAAIAGAVVQLSRTQIWLAALQLDASKHLQVVPEPELLFDGFIDQATINLDNGRDDVDYTLLSNFDYFFEDGEGERLNGQFHRSVWPGELGLDNVTGVRKHVYWGQNAPPGTSGGSSSIYSGGATGGGQFSYMDRLAETSR